MADKLLEPMVLTDLSDRTVVEIRPNGSKRVRMKFLWPSKTDQSFKKDCDVNLMVKRFMKTNKMNTSQFNAYMNKYAPNYSSTDIVDGTIPDYEFHLNAQIEADQMFLSLPAELRKKFDNNPAKFLDFAFKPENKLAMAEMGLLKPEVAQSLKDASRASQGASSEASSKSGSPSPDKDGKTA